MKRAGVGPTLIACACIAALVATRDAEACRAITPDGCASTERIGRTMPFFIAGMILAVPSLASHGMMLGWYVQTRTVPMTWPVVGLLLWSGHAALSTTMLVNSVDARYSGLIETSAIYAGVSYAAIVAATVALFAKQPPLPPDRRVTFAPWRTETASGVLLSGAF